VETEFNSGLCKRLATKPRAFPASIKEVAENIWLVSFRGFDLGFFDQDEGRVEPANSWRLGP